MTKKKEIIKQKFTSMLEEWEKVETHRPGAYWRLNRCSAQNGRRCHVHKAND